MAKTKRIESNDINPDYFYVINDAGALYGDDGENGFTTSIAARKWALAYNIQVKDGERNGPAIDFYSNGDAIVTGKELMKTIGESSLKRVSDHEYHNKKATVFKDTEWDEYVVRFWLDGKLLQDAEYHTDDKEDAQGTAKSWISAAKSESNSGLKEDSTQYTDFDEWQQDAEKKGYEVALSRDGWSGSAYDDYQNVVGEFELNKGFQNGSNAGTGYLKGASDEQDKPSNAGIFVADLGVEVQPSRWYVISDSNRMYGGAGNHFATKEAAELWVLDNPHLGISLGEGDDVVLGSDIIKAYNSLD